MPATLQPSPHHPEDPHDLHDPAAELAPGAALFDTADGRHIAAAPDGTYIELALGAAEWDRLRAALSPSAAGTTAAHDEVPGSGLGRALAFLREEGLVRTPAPAAPVAAGRVEVVASGDAAVVGAAIAALLRACAAVEEGLGAIEVLECDAASAEPPAGTVVAACAVGLPDRAWCDLDERLAAAGTPWHRCWSEGASLWAGPLSVPGSSASYRDLRLRRLAASSWPVELEAAWGDASSRPVPWSPTAAAAVAAAVADDVLGYLRSGEVDATARSWRGFDPRTRTWQRHPVLPIPTGVCR